MGEQRPSGVDNGELISNRVGGTGERGGVDTNGVGWVSKWDVSSDRVGGTGEWGGVDTNGVGWVSVSASGRAHSGRGQYPHGIHVRHPGRVPAAEGLFEGTGAEEPGERASERATRGASVSVTTPEYPGSTSGGEQEESQAADRDTRRACSYDCLTRAGVEDWRGTRESGLWSLEQSARLLADPDSGGVSS